VIQLLA